MYEEVLYKFALDCAEHRQKKDCNRQCKDCPSNVALYGQSKPLAVMMLHSAELELKQEAKYDAAYNRYMKERNDKIDYENKLYYRGIRLILLIVLLTALFVAWVWLRPKSNPAPEEFGVEHMQGTVATLERIYEADMNGDGLINCIDMAIQFYNIYPDRTIIRIIVQHNYKTDFHHLFVMIEGQGIEPAALLHSRYTADSGIQVGVEDYWGNRYDPKYDTDVTEHWPLIRVNKYRW
jgi:hypothetical protein